MSPARVKTHRLSQQKAKKLMHLGPEYFAHLCSKLPVQRRATPCKAVQRIINRSRSRDSLMQQPARCSHLCSVLKDSSGATHGRGIQASCVGERESCNTCDCFQRYSKHRSGVLHCTGMIHHNQICSLPIFSGFKKSGWKFKMLGMDWNSG